MTGYGKADALYEGKKIHVEVKSLNSKSLDLSMRLPSVYREKELELRKLVGTTLERGKIDFSIWVEKSDTKLNAPINEEVVKAYVAQINEISASQGLESPLNHWELLVRLPDITQSGATEVLTDEEWDEVMVAVGQALEGLVAFRQQEGEALYRKFVEKIDNIARLMKAIEPYETLRIEKIKSRIADRLAEMKEVEYDKNRFEQELIYYIEKLDINEEKQRLANHLAYFVDTMNDGHGQGKKLGFIAQEMGREINTTGSKSNLAEMQNLVVQMKDELEQIKEQVLNVL